MCVVENDKKLTSNFRTIEWQNYSTPINISLIVLHSCLKICDLCKNRSILDLAVVADARSFLQHKSALIFLHHHHPNDWWPMPTLENSFTIHLIFFLRLLFTLARLKLLSCRLAGCDWNGPVEKNKTAAEAQKRRKKSFMVFFFFIAGPALLCNDSRFIIIMSTHHKSSSRVSDIDSASEVWTTDREWVGKKKWSSADYWVNSRELHCQLVAAMCASLPWKHTEHRTLSGGRRRERWKTAAREAEKKFIIKRASLTKAKAFEVGMKWKKKYSHSRTAFFVLSVNSI